jgi:uncharacterized membrane protein
MGAIIIFGGYLLIAFITYSLLYYLCARSYSKDEYAKRMYKFEEYKDNHHSDIIMMSIIWISTLLAFILYSLTFIVRKSIEKHFNIED